MDIVKLKYFLMLVACGSFSNAADKLYISQSALSKNIKSLETLLNVELIDRSKHKLTLTPAGKAFLPYAEQTVLEYTKILNEMSYYSDFSKYVISMGVLPLADEYGISNIVTQYWIEHPELQISFIERNQVELETKLTSGSLSLAILRTDYLDHDKIEYTNIIEDKFVIACSNQNKLALRKSISLSELEDERFILLEEDSGITQRFKRECSTYGVIPLAPFYQTRHRPLLTAVSHNLGITALPQKLIERSFVTNLTVIPLEEEITTNIGIANNMLGCSSSACKALRDYIINYYRENPGF